MQVYNDFPLSEVLWYKVGGKAKYFIPATNKEDVLRALDFTEKNHPERIFICGLGSNLIFSDDYFNGVVIQIASEKYDTRGVSIKTDGVIEGFAGTILDDLITTSFKNNLIGMEWAGGLPGTVGAGVRGNVGAFGGEIKDSFINAEVLEIKEKGFSLSKINKSNFNFSYRNSVIKEQKNLIVISSQFQLHPTAQQGLQNAQEIYQSRISYRKANHPVEYPNCGSVFKNVHDKSQIEKIYTVWPEVRDLVETKWHGKASMGYLSKRLGFAGYRVGGMEVSTKHANFIVNLGNAKANDTLTIIKHIQEKVSDTFGFIPEVEVEIVR